MKKAKELFEELQELADTYYTLLEYIERAYEMATRTTSVFSDMPHSPNRDNQAHEKMLMKYFDMKASMSGELNEAFWAWQDAATELMRNIGKLKDRKYQDVLIHRFIVGLDPETTAEKMHISESYMFKLQNRALAALDGVLEKAAAKDEIE